MSARNTTVKLDLEQLEPRLVLTTIAFPIPSVPPIEVPVGPIAVPAATAAATGGAIGLAGPPIFGYLAGQVAGYLRAADAYVINNVSADEITAASQQSQTLFSAVGNFIKAEALRAATNMEVTLDYADGAAAGLVESGKVPSPLNAYLALNGLAFQAGAAEATFRVDEATLAVDVTKAIVSGQKSPSQALMDIVDDQANILSDVADNFQVDVAVALRNVSNDQAAAASADSALNSAFSALKTALQNPFGTSTGQTPPSSQFANDGDEPFPGGPDSDGDSDLITQ